MNELTGTRDVSLDQMEHDIRKYYEQIDRGTKFRNDDQPRGNVHMRQWPRDKMKACRFRKILE